MINLASKRFLIPTAILPPAFLMVCTIASAVQVPSGPCITWQDTGIKNCAPPPAQTETKWHPGHYVLMYGRNGLPSNYGPPDAVMAEPYVEGIQMRFDWPVLEPTKGNYDFSQIDSWLKYVESHNKRLVIQVMISTGMPVPNYIKNDALYGESASVNGVMRLWDSRVMDRVIALFKALGAKYDSEPAVEAIATNETAAFMTVKPSDFTRPKYATQLKRLYSAAHAAFPHTVVLAYTNFLSGEEPGLIDSQYKEKIGTGGPDIFANNPPGPTAAQIIVIGAPTYKGKFPIGYAVQQPELCGKSGCHLPADLLNYGVNTLGSNYIFWIKLEQDKYGNPPMEYTFTGGILPTIKKFQGVIQNGCPENVKPCKTN